MQPPRHALPATVEIFTNIDADAVLTDALLRLARQSKYLSPASARTPDDLAIEALHDALADSLQE